MQKPFVSVLIPCFNASEYILNCVSMLKKQNLKQVEFIFIDDGSTDNTLELLKKEVQNDDRIVVLTQSNSGPSCARNNGLKIATGDYIAFLDVDDRIDPSIYEKLYDTAVNEQAQITISGFYNTSFKNGKTEESKDVYLLTQNLYKNQEINFLIEVSLNEKLFSPLWNRIISRSFLIENNIVLPEDIRLHEDLVFNIAVFSKANIVAFVKEPLYYYLCDVPTSVSHKYRSSIFEETERISNHLISIVPKNAISYLEHFLFYRIRYCLKSCNNDKVITKKEKSSEFKKMIINSFSQDLLKKVFNNRDKIYTYKDYVVALAMKMKWYWFLKSVLK